MNVFILNLFFIKEPNATTCERLSPFRITNGPVTLRPGHRIKNIKRRKKRKKINNIKKLLILNTD